MQELRYIKKDDIVRDMYIGCNERGTWKIKRVPHGKRIVFHAELMNFNKSLTTNSLCEMDSYLERDERFYRNGH